MFMTEFTLTLRQVLCLDVLKNGVWYELENGRWVCGCCIVTMQWITLFFPKGNSWLIHRSTLRVLEMLQQLHGTCFVHFWRAGDKFNQQMWLGYKISYTYIQNLMTPSLYGNCKITWSSWDMIMLNGMCRLHNFGFLQKCSWGLQSCGCGTTSLGNWFPTFWNTIAV